MRSIPVSQPIISKNAFKYIKNSLDTGWLSSKGPYVEKFEEKFASFIGVKYVISTNSCTSALHLGLIAIGLKAKEEVIIPTLTMIATALPVIYIGAKPVFVEVEPDTGNIDVNKIEAAITKKTRAIIPVHLHGHPCDMAPILRLAKKYNLAVIEDAAEAHGAKYKLGVNWQKVGSLGTLACFSFYGNKVMTTGEGGTVTTNNKRIADKVRSLRNLARVPKKHFLHDDIGFAYRMGNLQAAIGLSQVEESNALIKRKIEIARLYNKKLSGIKQITLPLQKKYARSIYWHYGVIINKNSPFTRDQIVKKLSNKGIETRNFFIPLHKQPIFKKLGIVSQKNFPVAEELSQNGLALPSGVGIRNRDIDYVCDEFKKLFL